MESNFLDSLILQKLSLYDDRSEVDFSNKAVMQIVEMFL